MGPIYVALWLVHVFGLVHAVGSTEYHPSFRVASRFVLIGWALAVAALVLILFSEVGAESLGGLAFLPVVGAYFCLLMAYPTHVGVGLWTLFLAEDRQGAWWTLLQLPASAVAAYGLLDMWI